MDKEKEIRNHLERSKERREVESSAMGKMLEKLCRETLPKLSKERLKEIEGEAEEPTASTSKKIIIPPFKLQLVEVEAPKKRVQLTRLPDTPSPGPNEIAAPETTAKKLYPCQLCDSSYSRRHGLVKHVSEKHSNKPRLKCGNCDKNFEHGRNFELRRHEKSCAVTSLLLDAFK